MLMMIIYDDDQNWTMAPSSTLCSQNQYRSYIGQNIRIEDKKKQQLRSVQSGS